MLYDIIINQRINPKVSKIISVTISGVISDIPISSSPIPEVNSTPFIDGLFSIAS